MSGGYYGYKDEELMDRIFGYCRTTIRSKDYKKIIEEVRRDNPLEDPEISELVFDVLGLLHSFDWYMECDSGRDEYLADVKAFKDKWFGKTPQDRLKKLLEIQLEKLSGYHKSLQAEMIESIGAKK